MSAADIVRSFPLQLVRSRDERVMAGAWDRTWLERPWPKLADVLDDRIRSVLERLAAEDADERARGVDRALRARAVSPTTGRLLFALAAPQTGCEVLEIG